MILIWMDSNSFGTDFAAIAKFVGTRSSTQVRTHAQKYYAKLVRRFSPHMLFCVCLRLLSIYIICFVHLHRLELKMKHGKHLARSFVTQGLIYYIAGRPSDCIGMTY